MVFWKINFLKYARTNCWIMNHCTVPSWSIINNTLPLCKLTKYAIETNLENVLQLKGSHSQRGVASAYFPSYPKMADRRWQLQNGWSNITPLTIPLAKRHYSPDIIGIPTSVDMYSWGVLVFLKFRHFSCELKETVSLAATESEVWIGNFNEKAWKTTKHKLHKVWS